MVACPCRDPARLRMEVLNTDRLRERSAKTSFALDLAPYLKAERVEVLAGIITQ